MIVLLFIIGILFTILGVTYITSGLAETVMCLTIGISNIVAAFRIRKYKKRIAELESMAYRSVRMPPVSIEVVPTQNSKPKEKGVFSTHKCKETENNFAQLKSSFIVLDIETTGISRKKDRIISIAAIRFDNGKPSDRFYTYVNPGIPIPSGATAINGITDADVAAAPKEKEACTQLVSFLGKAINGDPILIAYNSPFDMGFIEDAMNRNNIPGKLRHFDILGFARNRLPYLENHKQITVAQHLGINAEGAHDAMRDCEMCSAIFLTLLNQ